MAFKTDESFLDKISMGAEATRAVREILQGAGHDIVELERYSSSNKLWQTKIKRMRVPDLICTKCGRRFEVRAKSTLEIRASHSRDNPDRFWDVGLRNEDVMAIVRSHRDERGVWRTSSIVNLFPVGALRASVGSARIGTRKSAAEGSEQDITWPSYSPSRPGTVRSITDDEFTLMLDSGRPITKKRVGNGTFVHIPKGGRVGPDTIVSSVVSQSVQLKCLSGAYDFLADLDSPDPMTVYCAVKAIGHLQAMRQGAVPKLRTLRDTIDEPRIRLEIEGTLARLDAGDWDYFRESFYAKPRDIGYPMEAAFILSELLPRTQAYRLLEGLACDNSRPSELRAAAIWGIMNGAPNRINEILPLIDDEDDTVSLHAMVAAIRAIQPADTPRLARLMRFASRKAKFAYVIGVSPGIDRAEIVRELSTQENQECRNALIRAVAIAGRTHYGNLLGSLDEELQSQIRFVWMQRENEIPRTTERDLSLLLLQQ